MTEFIVGVICGWRSTDIDELVKRLSNEGQAVEG